jgi:DNA uptake protein ComE-like DNA-binding protein
MRLMLITIVNLLLLATTGVQAQVGRNQHLIDPNLAERGELAGVPHLTEELAAAIVAGRPFTSAGQLDDFLSATLDEIQRSKVYEHMFRQLDLNSASAEEIMLVPQMSRRMAHEFEEYRTYTSLDQFRREIGKYVDEDEVARLEQYVFIPMNLNEASADDFMTIPGMSRRMVHEFEEYRPYTSMEQFRREIGKYVDAAEVARLESYVTLD